jgi:hypothetical protein
MTVTARLLMSAHHKPVGLQFFDMPARAVLTAEVRVMEMKIEMDGKRPLQEFPQRLVQSADCPFGFQGVPRMATHYLPGPQVHQQV